MKLGEALSRLKKEKSRLARSIKLRKDNVYIQEGAKSPFDPKELTVEIDTLIEGIRKLKIQIQERNLKTPVAGEKISLAEAIIKVNDLRSKLFSYHNIFEQKREYHFRDRDEKNLISQLDEQEIEDLIEKLEIEKTQLDNKIQITNWTTDL